MTCVVYLDVVRGLDGVCVVGRDLLREVLRVAEQPAAWLRRRIKALVDIAVLGKERTCCVKQRFEGVSVTLAERGDGGVNHYFALGGE